MAIDFTDHHQEITRLTDSQAKALVLLPEPEPASVVLTAGLHGSAWQRSFDDGLWYCTQRRGGGKTWEWLTYQRNLVLVYEAPIREAH